MKKILALIILIVILNSLTCHIHAQSLKGQIFTEAITNKIWVDSLKKDSIIVSRIPFGFLRVLILDSLKQLIDVTYTDSDGKYMFENTGKGKGKYYLQVKKKQGETEEIQLFEKNIYIKYDVNYLKAIIIK